jgi:multidrug efflux pump subunit AcrA (membrane-fusion protein)
MNMQNKKTYLITAIALVVIIILSFAFSNNSKRLVPPKIAPVTDAVYALGIVKTDRWYNVRFGMSTVVHRLYVTEGQEVSTGAPLLMTDSGIIFRAPFSGIVTLIPFRESEMAPAGQAILTLADTKHMYVRVSLDQKSIVMVRKGQKAELSFENLRDSRTEGIVESVYPSSNEFVVRIGVRNFPEGVLPEMNCDTAIIIRKNDRAILVPRSAIKNAEIIAERKGTRMRIKVNAKPVDKDFSEIIEGDIKDDDLIVVNSAKKR